MARVRSMILPAAAALWALHHQAAWATPAPAPAAPAQGQNTCACGMNAATCPHCSPQASGAARATAPAASQTCACGKPAGSCAACQARRAQPSTPARACACGRSACDGSCRQGGGHHAAPNGPAPAAGGHHGAPAAGASPRVCACGKPAGSCDGACAHGARPAPAPTNACPCGCGMPAGACGAGCAPGGQGPACHGDRPASAAPRPACEGDCHGAGGHPAPHRPMAHHGLPAGHPPVWMGGMGGHWGGHPRPRGGTELRALVGGLGLVPGSSANHQLGLARRVSFWGHPNLGLGFERGAFVQLNPAAGNSPWVSPHLGLVPMVGADLGPVRLEASAMAGLGFMARTGAGDTLQLRGQWVAEPRLEVRGQRTRVMGHPMSFGLSAGYLFSGNMAELSGPNLGLRASFR